ncbi:hypothetical protein [Streptomyces sp. NPDC090994]|uniref:hypothetical protein n=1 Tax=Streptomyces sp. NPDC090994 TaxID=3365969 RepID=UPI00381668D4
MTDSPGTPRRLPWTGPDGKPAYLLTDGTGPLSRLVDAVDAQQLEMAGRLLDHAADILDDHSATSDQLRYLLTCMYDALTDVRRIAEHRRGADR